MEDKIWGKIKKIGFGVDGGLHPRHRVPPKSRHPNHHPREMGRNQQKLEQQDVRPENLPGNFRRDPPSRAGPGPGPRGHSLANEPDRLENQAPREDGGAEHGDGERHGRGGVVRLAEELFF